MRKRIIKENRILLSWIPDLFECFSLRETLREIGAMILAVAVSAGLGTALMIGVYAFPGEKADQNAARSAAVFQEEGVYPRLYSWCHSQIDGWTDAIMLLTAVDHDGDDVVDRAMENRHGRLKDKNPVDSLLGHYVDGKTFDYEFIYGRYWHGYLVWLKPLLSMTDLRGIRAVNGLCQFTLAALTAWLMFKREKRLILPFLLTWLMLMPVALAKCMQFSACYYLAVGGTIVLLAAKTGRPDHRTVMVFVFIGIATAFFDFLSYPIATFGIPAVVWLALFPDDSTGRRLGKLIKSGFGWGLGYFGMWASKWSIGSALTGTDLVADAANALEKRTSGFSWDGTVRYTISECLSDNFTAFFRTPFTVLVILFLAAAVGLCLMRRSDRRPGSSLFPYALTAALPILWYAFTLNHSVIHFWFTNKALSVFVFAIMCGLAEQAFPDKRTPIRGGAVPDDGGNNEG